MSFAWKYFLQNILTILLSRLSSFHYVKRLYTLIDFLNLSMVWLWIHFLFIVFAHCKCIFSSDNFYNLFNFTFNCANMKWLSIDFYIFTIFFLFLQFFCKKCLFQNFILFQDFLVSTIIKVYNQSVISVFISHNYWICY